ncbi:conserved hypothetical protein [Gammaproteobacteria bacterium]
MRPSRGMGAIMPDKMPKGKKKARRDDTDFTEYKEGGDVKMAGGGLYANINARKKAGTSRSKSKSTITSKAYANMKKGFPK